ncbi:MAG: zinc ribbon domain-containing protein [Planctomycetaceae bacterium]|nr:zinc ribbon domain-containing protein [Planctomycetaceae bacterium]
MPIFEYRCPECDTEFEQLVRNGEPVACPECSSAKVEKLFSAHAAHVAAASLPIAPGCSPDGPPCRPNCCRM